MSNSSGSSRGIDSETMIWICALCGFGGGGLLAANRLAEPLTDWLVSVHVLAGPEADLVLDFGNGSGLDVIRIVLLCALLVLGLVGAVAAVRAWHRFKRRVKERAAQRKEERERR